MIKKAPKLIPRLALLYSLIKDGRRICDIGTDHAYLPVNLVLFKNSPFCIAADINKEPLKRAESTIKKFGCENKIKTVLSDGFSNIDPSEFDDAVIAGMGGELIASILDKSVEINGTLYLQPMTAVIFLRKYLYNNGYTVIDEHLSKEGEKIYIVLEVICKKDDRLLEPLFGSCLINHMGELEKEYLQRLISKHQKIVSGLSKAKDNKNLKSAEKDLAKLMEVYTKYVDS